MTEPESDPEDPLGDWYADDLGWVDRAGRHLYAAICIYRKHVRADDGHGPDVALIRFLYELQEHVTQ